MSSVKESGRGWRGCDDDGGGSGGSCRTEALISSRRSIGAGMVGVGVGGEVDGLVLEFRSGLEGMLEGRELECG